MVRGSVSVKDHRARGQDSAFQTEVKHVLICPMTPRGGYGLLAGKTVIVTAAAGTGIGFATAKRCVEEGARVLVSDIHEQRLAKSVEDLRRIEGAEVFGRRCNVTSETDVAELIDSGIAELGHVD